VVAAADRLRGRRGRRHRDEALQLRAQVQRPRALVGRRLERLRRARAAEAREHDEQHAGARQQDIIRHLFKTRTLATLRLWGRALSYIKEDQPLRFAWSVLTKADFVAAQASQENSAGLIDELLKTASGTDFVLMLTERATGIHGALRAVVPSMDVSVIANQFGGGGHPQAAAFMIDGAKIAEREQEIINKIRQFVQEHNGHSQSQPASTQTSSPVRPTQVEQSQHQPAPASVQVPHTPPQPAAQAQHQTQQPPRQPDNRSQHPQNRGQNPQGNRPQYNQPSQPQQNQNRPSSQPQSPSRPVEQTSLAMPESPTEYRG